MTFTPTGFLTLKLLSRLSIATSVRLFARLASLVVVALSAWFVHSQYQLSLAERQHLVRSAVETANGVLHWAHEQERAGAMTRSQAQDAAKAAIGRMRYAGSEYFWINDMGSRIVMHPIKPELNGTEGATIKDPQGKALFVAFVDRVRADRAGFVDYLWPKPGKEQPVEKLSYVAGFEPWGWVIGSGLYLDDLRDQMWSTLRNLGIVALLALGLLLLTMRSVIDSCLHGVARVVTAARAVAAGDLSHRIDHHASGEIGELVAAMNQMTEGLQRIVGTVREAAVTMTRATDEIAAGNNDLSSRTEQQAAALQQTAASMEELGSTVRQNAQNALQANELALGATAVAERGGAVVGQVVQTMKGINDSSRRIAEITAVIDGIAFQTNILALNAAVEAARAGEQGRGFAVVASEVRSLAQRAGEAARQIKGLIGVSVERVAHGGALVDQAGSTMQEVVESIRRVTELMGQISSASAEQSAGVAQVAEAVTTMDRATQQNASLVQESAAAAQSLSDQAHRLAQAVSVFRVAAEREARPAG